MEVIAQRNDTVVVCQSVLLEFVLRSCWVSVDEPQISRCAVTMCAGVLNGNIVFNNVGTISMLGLPCFSCAVITSRSACASTPYLYSLFTDAGYFLHPNTCTHGEVLLVSALPQRETYIVNV